MKKPPVDPIVRAARAWLKQEMASEGDVNAADGAVIVYRMVTKFTMTAGQYWQVADESMQLAPAALLAPWLSVQVWRSLSDWDGTGDGLARLYEGAVSFWAKDSDLISSRDYMMRELRARMSEITPRLTWGAAAFKGWLEKWEHPLAKWSAQDIRALPVEVHQDLMSAYLGRGGDHDHFDLDAVRVLIDSRQWSAENMQKSIMTFMRSSCGNPLGSQGLLIAHTWLDTLEWAPANAEAHVLDICLYLKHEALSEWENFLPRIGNGLACLADNPDELSRIVDLIPDADPKIGAPKLMARLIASVNAQLPEHLVLKAIETGGLLAVMGNKNYPIAQKLTWLKGNTAHVFYEGDVLSHMARVDLPIKEAIALWCSMQAVKGELAPALWPGVPLFRKDVVKKEFLAMHAPNIGDRIDIVNTLGLSYAEAVDMLVDAGDGKMTQPMLCLPEIETPGESGQAILR
jgi:hypothetical protein